MCLEARGISDVASAISTVIFILLSNPVQGWRNDLGGGGGGLGLEGPLRKRAPSASKGPKSYYLHFSCVAVHKRYVEGKYA